MVVAVILVVGFGKHIHVLRRRGFVVNRSPTIGLAAATVPWRSVGIIRLPQGVYRLGPIRTRAVACVVGIFHGVGPAGGVGVCVAGFHKEVIVCSRTMV